MKKILFLPLAAIGCIATSFLQGTESEIRANKIFLEVCGNPQLPKNGSSLKERVDHFYELALRRGVEKVEYLFKKKKLSLQSRAECIGYLATKLSDSSLGIFNRKNQEAEPLDGLICAWLFSCQEVEIGKLFYGNASSKVASSLKELLRQKEKEGPSKTSAADHN